MPDDLASLVRLILEDIATQMAGMESGHLSIDQWQQQMAQTLLVGHNAAYMVAVGRKELSDVEQRLINKIVGGQLDYLNGFASDMDSTGWLDKYRARGDLYAGALKASYWRGKTRGYDLPAYPTEGSECMVNCQCAWELDEIDAEELDADCYWKLGSAEHCQTCVQRAQDWSPYKIRGGEAA